MSARASEPPASRAPRVSRNRFIWALAGVTVAALAVRVTYVLVARQGVHLGGDSYFYHAGANLLAQGHGFIEPFVFRRGHTAQAAEHPPLYLVYLAIPSVFGMTSTLTHLLWSCVLGAATVLVVGLVGRSLVSPRVGLVAAIIAALYPNTWLPDGLLEAGSAAMFITALTLLLAYHYLQRPGPGRLAAVGAAAGAAALARSELILLVPLVVAPLALMTHTMSFRRQLRCLGIAVVATLVVIGPWIGFNMARFRHPVYLSAQYPALLASANCDRTYHGSLLGYFSVPCAAKVARREHARGDQSQAAIGFQRGALRYIRHHLGRVPVVVAARLGRILEVYRPDQNLRLREFFDGVEKSIAPAALFSFYPLALLSIIGMVLLRRRGVPILPLCAVPVIVLITVAVTYANTRFRSPAEVVLAVLSAVTIDAIAAWFAERRASRARSGLVETTAANGATVVPTTASRTVAVV